MALNYDTSEREPVPNSTTPENLRGSNADYHQSVPFLSKSTIDASKHHASTSSIGTLVKDTGSSPKNWPQGPSPLHKRSFWTCADLVWDVLVTALPIMFFVLGFAALDLDGRERSGFGDAIVEASRYGTTAFPIVFAAVVARLMKAVALWKCERGATLGILEQLIGSQSLAGTVERFFLLRRFDTLGLGVVTLWLLSPIGSQLSLRMLKIQDTVKVSQQQIQYFNTTGYASADYQAWQFAPSYMKGGLDTMSSQAALTALLGATMLASENVTKSPMDPWNNVKVPLYDISSLRAASGNPNQWFAVDQNIKHTWASLSGLMIMGAQENTNSTFKIETSYMDLSCSDVINVQYDSNNDSKNNVTTALRSAGFPLHAVKNPFARASFSDSRVDTSYLDYINFNSLVDDPPTNVFYVFKPVTTVDERDEYLTEQLQVYNCSLEHRAIEGNISCVGHDCAMNEVTLLDRNGPFAASEFAEVLGFIPNGLGSNDFGHPSPLDNYLLGHDNPFFSILEAGSGDQQYFSGFEKMPGSVFARRLATVLNTVWQANICPYGISLGPSANLSMCRGREMINSPSANTTATVVSRTEQARYVANKTRAATLIAITFLLQACALGGLILNITKKAPDILGYVSTMTRGNIYAVTPPGGNTLDGLERSRFLANMEVRLADSKPQDDVGHIVFASTSASQDLRVGRLNQKRLYY